MNERLVMSQLSSNRVGSRESGESGESSSGSDESTSGSVVTYIKDWDLEGDFVSETHC